MCLYTLIENGQLTIESADYCQLFYKSSWCLDLGRNGLHSIERCMLDNRNID